MTTLRVVGLLALSVVSFCSAAHAQDRFITQIHVMEHRPSWKPALIYGAAMGLDGLSTEMALSLKDEKGTPWMHEKNIVTGNVDSRAWRLMVYSAQVTGYTLLDRQLQKRHRKLAWVMRAGVALMHGSAAFNNFQHYRQVDGLMRGNKRPPMGRPNFRHPESR